jgi:F-type H+-transporting ATPase subunit delta
MNEGRISIRYAAALFAFAVEKKCEDKVYEQIQVLSNSFFQIPALALALSNPTYTKQQKLDLLITASGKKIEKELNTFFEFVLDKGREDFLLFICMSFQDAYRKEKKLVVGEITSAVKVNEKAIKQITDFVKAKYDQKLELITKTDSSLIGGFVFEVNNQRIDASVKEALRQLEISMTA